MLPLITPSDSLLLIIDIQERLSKVLNQSDLKKVCEQINLLVTLAADVGIPILVTEQYPKGLGPTIKPILKILKDKKYDTYDKITFGCCKDLGFCKKLRSTQKKNIILTGMETHVCVYLTALGLMRLGYKPFVASDAVISREKFYTKNGLMLMRDMGAVITNTETLLFQLMGQSGGSTFKKISGLLKKRSS